MTGLSGVGIGWRPEIAGYIASLPGLRFTEVVAESLPGPGNSMPTGLAELAARVVSVVPHGVRLSLGGAEPVQPERVAHLAHCAALVGAPLVSEHIAFVRAGGIRSRPSSPVPRSRDALEAIGTMSGAPRPSCRCRSRWNRSPRWSTGPMTS